jgi:Rod binding domain-containing protein
MPIRVDGAPHSVVQPQQHDSTKALREKAAEFEGILLSEILQKMSDCYKVPGADDTDSTGESFRAFASSALGGGLARSGGVGIGEMLVRSLSPVGSDKSSP